MPGCSLKGAPHFQFWDNSALLYGMHSKCLVCLDPRKPHGNQIKLYCVMGGMDRMAGAPSSIPMGDRPSRCCMRPVEEEPGPRCNEDSDTTVSASGPGRLFFLLLEKTNREENLFLRSVLQMFALVCRSMLLFFIPLIVDIPHDNDAQLSPPLSTTHLRALI